MVNHTRLILSATTLHTPLDPLTTLPPEIWQFILAVACNGSMAAVLQLTMVSPGWCQAFTESPLLWQNIRLDESDEDSLATIALFLHLSKRSPLVLQIAVPLSSQFDQICAMLCPHQERIREIVLQPGRWASGPARGSRYPVSDGEYFRTLERVTRGLESLPSLRSLDVVSGRPIRVGSQWTPPPSVSSTGHWLVSSANLARFTSSLHRWGYLTIHAKDLVGPGSRLSRIGRIQNLCVYSDEVEHSQPESWEIPVDFSVPKLHSLECYGRMDCASIWLVTAASRTIQHLDLHLSIQDLDHIIAALKYAPALRSFRLAVLAPDSALAARPRRRVQLPMSVRNWAFRINNSTPANGDFKCEMQLGSDKRSLETLWECFHHVFPVAHLLLYNPRIDFGTLRVLLSDEFQLQTASPTPLSSPATEEVDKPLHLRIPGPVAETMVAEAMIADTMTSIRRSRMPLYPTPSPSHLPINRPAYSISPVSRHPEGTLRFHWGEPIPVLCRAPLDHSRWDWVGIYRDGENTSPTTHVSSQGRWVTVHKEEWDGDIARPLGEHPDDRSAECGELVFRQFALPFEAGSYELRYHVDGKYESVAQIRHIQVHLDRPHSLTFTCVHEWLRRIVCLALDSDASLIPKSAMSPNLNLTSHPSSSTDSFFLESPPASPNRNPPGATSPLSPFSTESSVSSGILGFPSTPPHKYQDDDFHFWTDSNGTKTGRQAKRIAYAIEEALDVRIKPDVIVEYANVRALTRRILRSLWRKQKATSRENSGDETHSNSRPRTRPNGRSGSSDHTLAKSPFR